MLAGNGLARPARPRLPVLQSRWWSSTSGAEKRDYLLVEAAPEPHTEPTTYSCAVEIYLKGGDAWILARILH